jgi:hypothetical protein
MVVIKRLPRLIMILGAALLAFGIGSGLYQTGTALRFGNLGSRPDWVQPTPTPFDEFVLGFPVRVFIITGVGLLVAGYVGARLSRYWQSSN